MRIQISLVLLISTMFINANAQTSDSVFTEKEYYISAHAMAATDFNDSLLKEYIKLYPKGDFVNRAKDNIDVCAWQNARYKNTKESYQKYLTEFPKGKAVQLAKRNIEVLERDIPEE